MIRAIALSLFLLLAGIAAAGEIISPSEVVVIPAGHGIVYLYRPNQFANKLIKPGIIVDTKEYPMLPAGKYLKFVLTEGDHEFALKLSEHYKGSAAGRIKVMAGTTSYLRLETSNQDIDSQTFERQFRFLPVLADEAAAQIVKCKGIDLEKGKRYRKSFIADN